jgi:glutamine amidotransferase
MTLAVVNLGVGNTASMVFALERLGAKPVLTSDSAIIGEAERVILPGVGAAAFAMERMEALGLTEVLKAFPRPLLGVCLGQQLLFASSEEGDAHMLGRIPGEVRRIEPAPDRPVPHMGWNSIRLHREDPLLEGVADEAYVYFVHSFASRVGSYTLASSDYGGAFSAIVRRENAWGCQFHPERSSEPGAKILRNFLSLPC